jgi:small acid-soluble spore protein F (minor alpha/beta-type SASP)
LSTIIIDAGDEEVYYMARRNSKMSEQLKYEIAKELGVDQIVASQGWGAVSSRDCGNIVTKAIEIAERSVTHSNL